MSRLVAIPLVLFVAVSGAAFGLAKWHPAKPGNAVSGPVKLGDQYRGETDFQQSCSACHGMNGKGGIGPKLQGLPVTIARVKAQIDNGGSTMPAGLVKGGEEEDVLAYVATLIASK